ncbi:MAG: Crp/Fnr family transcriptional regulator [Rhodocyclaceae bacterium]|nr:Crp/Fnr family transcriptional regulator [Rhodocyclaceae bacterium]
MVCSNIPLDEFACFHPGIEDFRFGHHATIFGMGTPTQGVYFIRAGAVKMVRCDPSGDEHIVRVLIKGDIAGLESTFASHHEHAAVAVGDVHACRIAISDFLRLAAKYPTLQARLFEKSHAALIEAETWLAEFVGGSIPIRTRVARLLLHLRDGDANRIRRFYLDDMAAIIGSTQETVSRVIAAFMRQGLLMKDDDVGDGRYFRGDIAALTKIGKEGEVPMAGRNAKAQGEYRTPSVRADDAIGIQVGVGNKDIRQVRSAMARNRVLVSDAAMLGSIGALSKTG